MSDWLKLCFSPFVMRRAILTALVVGTVLIVINYSNTILQGHLSGSQLIRMALTVLVPYCVSTYSSVSTIQSLKAGNL